MKIKFWLAAWMVLHSVVGSAIPVGIYEGEGFWTFEKFPQEKNEYRVHLSVTESQWLARYFLTDPNGVVTVITDRLSLERNSDGSFEILFRGKKLGEGTCEDLQCQYRYREINGRDWIEESFGLSENETWKKEGKRLGTSDVIYWSETLRRED